MWETDSKRLLFLPLIAVISSNNGTKTDKYHTHEHTYHTHEQIRITHMNRHVSHTRTGLTYQHFIHDHSQGPPVTQFVVASLHEDFRSNVVWRSDCGIRLQRSSLSNWHSEPLRSVAHSLEEEVLTYWCLCVSHVGLADRC